jgi:hypothetical protein
MEVDLLWLDYLIHMYIFGKMHEKHLFHLTKEQ